MSAAHMPNVALDIAGVVLAGGLSSRMGIEKAHIKAYGPTAPDMLTHTCELLQKHFKHVWVSCRPDNIKTHYTCITDIYPALGPFSGVHAALVKAKDVGLQAVCTLSCDLPFMASAILLRLLEARETATKTSHMTTFRQQETGFIESLTAIYEVSALPYFMQAMERGERKLSRIIPSDGRTDVVYTHSEALPFFNLNYPADLEVFRRMVKM